MAIPSSRRINFTSLQTREDVTVVGRKAQLIALNVLLSRWRRFHKSRGDVTAIEVDRRPFWSG